MSFVSNDNQIDALKDRFMVWFFAGGESGGNKFNVFTGSFIRFMKQILEKDFNLVKGIYFRTPMMNVAWALNNSQKPIANPQDCRITEASFQQIMPDISLPGTQLVIVSSSTGSVAAAQTACYLAERNRDKRIFGKSFHLALGASMISKESELFMQLCDYQREGIIGKLIYDELQDDGDSANGAGSTTRGKAWINAFSLMFPWLAAKFNQPSFLNTHPEKGHLHRRRSQTVQKALDFIEVLFVKHNLAGDHYQQKALSVIEQESGKI